MIDKFVPAIPEKPSLERLPTEREKETCARFVMLSGEGAFDPVESTERAERALDFYTNPKNIRAIQDWLADLGVGVFSKSDPTLLNKTLENLAKRAPKKADELRSLGWDIPVPKKLDTAFT